MCPRQAAPDLWVGRGRVCLHLCLFKAELCGHPAFRGSASLALLWSRQEGHLGQSPSGRQPARVWKWLLTLLIWN